MNEHRGFTVIELLIAIAIIGILLGVAAPSLRDAMMNAAITGQANDLMGDIAVARSEAVKRGVRTGVCTSTNGTSCTNSTWQNGWIVFLDGDADGAIDAGTTPLKVQPANNGQSTWTSAGHGTNGAGARFIAFSPSGALIGTLVNVTFTLCDSRTTTNVGTAATNKGRQIAINSTGRARVQRFTCP